MRFVPILFALVLLSLVTGVSHAQQYVVPEVEVQQGPPPPRVEVQTARPSAAHTWIPGHWAWRFGAHQWMPGHWAMAPQPGMVWEPARWTPRGPRWVFVEGHWRWAAPPAQTYYEPAPVAAAPVVEVQAAPPAPIVEIRPGASFPNAVWINGYWHWNGYNHVWVGGRWSAQRPGWAWEPHRWVGGPGHWRMEPGHWRR